MEGWFKVDAFNFRKLNRSGVCFRPRNLAVFGIDSGLAILLFTLMFMLSTYVVLKISYEVRADHFVPVLERLVGPWLAKVYDVLIVLYLFTTTTVMIAGGGVTLEMYHVPFWVGIGAFCLFSFMIFSGM